MSDLAQFKDVHKGETCLIVGLGENLHKTPPEWFDYPSFGVNACHRWEGEWIPDYYVTVDNRNMQEYGAAIAEKFASIPKFVRSPNLDAWRGENFYRFKRMSGPLWDYHNSGSLWQDDVTDKPITYANIMHVVFKLCFHMGFTTMLIVGMEHRQHYGDRHCYGIDVGTNADAPLDVWFEGYRQLQVELSKRGVTVLNISQDTYVPEEILPRGNWREWTAKEKEVAYV